MIYVMKHRNGTYFHSKNRIILYESQEQAMVYLEAFIQYAVNRATQEKGHMAAMTMPMEIQSNTVVLPIDFDIDKSNCETVYLKDL